MSKNVKNTRFALNNLIDFCVVVINEKKVEVHILVFPWVALAMPILYFTMVGSEILMLIPDIRTIFFPGIG